MTGGSEDDFIYFWDLVDASVVSRFTDHNSVVKSRTTFRTLEANCVEIVLKGRVVHNYGSVLF